MSEMFCFQCQQTAGGSGCVRTGVCGKQPDTAHLQDELVVELIGLACAIRGRGGYDAEGARLLADGLFTTLTNVNFDNVAIRDFTARVAAARAERGGALPKLELWKGETDIVSLRSTLLFGLKGMAAYAHHAMNLGQEDEEVYGWFARGLSALTEESLRRMIDRAVEQSHDRAAQAAAVRRLQAMEHRNVQAARSLLEG